MSKSIKKVEKTVKANVKIVTQEEFINDLKSNSNCNCANMTNCKFNCNREQWVKGEYMKEYIQELSKKMAELDYWMDQEIKEIEKEKSKGKNIAFFNLEISKVKSNYCITKNAICIGYFNQFD
jgi:hypothetical protein